MNAMHWDALEQNEEGFGSGKSIHARTWRGGVRLRPGRVHRWTSETLALLL